MTLSIENLPATIDQIAWAPTTRKVYRKPAILHELELETRAGSPLGPNPLEDPFNFNSDQ